MQEAADVPVASAGTLFKVKFISPDGELLSLLRQRKSAKKGEPRRRAGRFWFVFFNVKGVSPDGELLSLLRQRK